MRYDVKVIINGVEVTDQASDSSPSITGVSYQNSVSEGPLQIGTAAVDKLTFTLLNPYKASFDGDKVELWVNPDEDEEGIDRLSELEELIGDETDDEGIDEDDTDVYEDETEEDGEDLTDEELEESEAEEAELDAKVIEQVNGESTDNEEAESTDEAEEETWRLIGTFFVYKQKQTDTGIQLTCYDSMMFLHGSYTPDTATDTVQNHYNAFRTACQEETGVPIDEMEFDDAYNKTITWDFTCSYRDALGYFAGLVGGYAHADADGEIGISFYLASDITLLSEELLSYNEESAGELVLDGMSCNRSRATNLTTDLIETGAGQAVSFTNPFVDEEMLQDIFEMYRGMRYIGASLSCRWDESLQAGELIRIMSEAEYENWLRMNNAADATEDEANEKEIQLQMAQLGKMVLIGTQTMVFAGEAVSTIRSTSRAETAKENEMISPWKKSAMELADAAASAKTTAENATNAAGTAGTAAKQAAAQADQAKTDAANAQNAANKVNIKFSSLIRKTDDGIECGMVPDASTLTDGNSVIVPAALVNTDGSFDVNLITYTNTSGTVSRTKSVRFASFGKEAVIGETNQTHARIDTDSFDIIDADGSIRASLGGSTPMIQIGKFTFVNRENGNLTLRLNEEG